MRVIEITFIHFQADTKVMILTKSKVEVKISYLSQK
jgi:hypothetical protein